MTTSHDTTHDDCTGCGGRCVGETPTECRGPSPVPWLEKDRCMYFYEARVFPGRGNERERLFLRVVYEHRMCLVGRQQGPLLYTTTLLPGETVDLYQEDRYRRVRSQEERVSVHSSFRQTMAALSESRRTGSTSTYARSLTSVRTEADTSVSAGGGLAGFFGAPSVSTDVTVAGETTVATGASVSAASDDFVSFGRTASQSLEAERAVVVSTFEDAESRDVTVRHLRNDNHCYAVTYYVRRVNEVYESGTRVAAVEWTTGQVPWRAIDDLAGVPAATRRLIAELARQAPKPGEERRDERRIALPTDGVVYEPELAHCSSCEPVREAQELAALELLRLRARRECLETEVLALEIERRRALGSGEGAAELALDDWEWSFAPPPAQIAAGAGADEGDPH
jgi:thermitase